MFLSKKNTKQVEMVNARSVDIWDCCMVDYGRLPVYMDPQRQGLMKFFENIALMYRQNFKNFLQNVWTAASIGSKSQSLFGLSIRPPKKPNLFRQGHQALKNSQFHLDSPQKWLTLPPSDNQTVNCTYRIMNKSLSIHPVCITHLTQFSSALQVLVCPHNSL
jgi:hypothetical protein